MSTRLTLSVVLTAIAAALPAPAGAVEKHGFVEFPRDEHQHVDGWDYWWGTADLVAESGNRYTLGIAHVVFNGAAPASAYQLFPRQGPYKGQAIMTIDGPKEWGHPDPAGRVVHDNSRYVPAVSELMRLRTRDAANDMKLIDSWERTSLDKPAYKLLIDQDDAKVHPAGDQVRFGVDLDMTMREEPLLAGGSGQWWYGIPQNYKYPSRSYQYMQAAKQLTGTLEVTQPDGSLLREQIVPEKSRLLVVHEYDATPEDIPAGLATAEATQLHPRYPQYYNYDWPWELIYADLDNGAGLMLAVLDFNDTEQGTVRPVTPNQPTFQVLATVMLPDGTSVPLDNDDLGVEHLSRRFFDGMNSAGGSAITSLYTQSWDFRVRYRGGSERTPDGKSVDVPAFDLGLTPALGSDEPKADGDGNRLSQRVPFDVAGSWAGCPMHGFGWSELLVNWYGQEDRDPFYTGGKLPPVPPACGEGEPAPPGTPQKPTGADDPPWNTTTERCTADNPGTPKCEYDAQGPGGIAGSAKKPGDWTVTITRPGRAEPIVIPGRSGNGAMPCGTIRKGDHVSVAAHAPGASVTAGNPGFCI